MSNVDQGKMFEKEVELILQIKGYQVIRNNLINGTQIDLMATKNDPLERVGLVVECADREKPIGVDLVKEKSSVLQTLRDSNLHYRLMFVTRVGFTAEAKTFAGATPDISLLTLNELESLLLDLNPYVSNYITNYEKSFGVFKEGNLFTRYVDLRAKEESSKVIPSLDSYMRNWLDEPENNLLFILGDYGAGKTSFSRHFTYQLLREKYVEQKPVRYTPILINLRDHRGSLDLKKVIVDSFSSTYGIQIPSSASFERFCATGNVLLLLDGFDEMNDRSDARSIMTSFKQIYLFAALSSKIILTCRSNFFDSNRDVIAFLHRFSVTIPFADEEEAVVAPLRDQGKILYLEGLDEKQIEEFVKKRFGDKSAEILKSIKSIHDLSDLSTRPVLLDMILTTLPEIGKTSSRINSAGLYRYYTDKWIRRDEWRVQMEADIRKSFCEALAWTMHCAGANSIPYELLEDILKATLTTIAKSDAQLLMYLNDLKTCSFLVRTAENDEFRFAHKSFREFFVAKKIITDIISGLSLRASEAPGLRREPVNEKNNRKQKSSQAPAIHTSRSLFDELDLQPLVGMVGAGKSNTFQNIAFFSDALSEKILSNQPFFSVQDIEFSRTKFPQFSATAFRNHLETEIKSVFKKAWSLTYSEEIEITEEIATFAMEHFTNLGHRLKDLIWKASDERTVDILCDVLRLSKGHEWLGKESDVLRDYIKKGSSAHLKIVCATLLIRIPQSVTIAFAKDAMTNLTAEGFSYFLFELASDGDKFKGILNQLMQDKRLGPIDKVICLYGLGGDLPIEQGQAQITDLTRELVKSENDREQFLAAIICGLLPEGQRIEILIRSIREADSDSMRNRITELVKFFVQDVDWQVFRRMKINEKDPYVKELLAEIEQRARDVESDINNRSGWKQIKDKHGIRDALWKRRR